MLHIFLLLNRLMPAEGVMPAAGDVRLAAFVERAVAVAPHLRRHVVAVLGALPDDEALAAVPDAKMDEILRRIEAEHRTAFAFLVQAAYAGYYEHPQVQAALGWADFEAPPAPQAAFDLALLEPVRQRPSPTQV